MAGTVFKVECREEGRWRPDVEKFASLKDARDYIRSMWQGPEYIDGPASFHNDYCAFLLVGFSLADVGIRRWNGDWFEWDWLDLG